MDDAEDAEDASRELAEAPAHLPVASFCGVEGEDSVVWRNFLESLELASKTWKQVNDLKERIAFPPTSNLSSARSEGGAGSHREQACPVKRVQKPSQARLYAQRRKHFERETERRKELAILLEQKAALSRDRSLLTYLQKRVRDLRERREELERQVASRKAANRQLRRQLYLRSKLFLWIAEKLRHSDGGGTKALLRLSELRESEKHLLKDLVRVQSVAIEDLFSIFPLSSLYGREDASTFTIAGARILKSTDTSRHGNTRDWREYATAASYTLFFTGMVSFLLGLPVYHQAPVLRSEGGLCVPGFGGSQSMIWQPSHAIKRGTSKSNRYSTTECFPLWHPRLAQVKLSLFMHMDWQSPIQLSNIFVHEESLLSESLKIMERSIHCIFCDAARKYGHECKEDLESLGPGGIFTELFAIFLNYVNGLLKPSENERNVPAQGQMVEVQHDSGQYATDYVEFLNAHEGASPSGRDSGDAPIDTSLLPLLYCNFMKAAKEP